MLVVNSKKFGKMRLCVNYLGSYPSSCINGCPRTKFFQRLVPRARITKLLDWKEVNGIQLFTAGRKLRQFEQVPFDVANGEPKFQRKMDESLNWIQ